MIFVFPNNTDRLSAWAFPGIQLSISLPPAPALKPVIKQSPWCDYAALLTRLGLELLPFMKQGELLLFPEASWAACGTALVYICLSASVPSVSPFFSLLLVSFLSLSPLPSPFLILFLSSLLSFLSSCSPLFPSSISLFHLLSFPSSRPLPLFLSPASLLSPFRRFLSLSLPATRSRLAYLFSLLPFSSPPSFAPRSTARGGALPVGTVPASGEHSVPRVPARAGRPRPSHLPAGLIGGARTMATLSRPRTGPVVAVRTLLVAASREESQRARSKAACANAFVAGERPAARARVPAGSRPRDPAPTWERSLLQTVLPPVGSPPPLSGSTSPFPEEGVSSSVYSLQSALRAFCQSREKEGGHVTKLF